ncbi:CST complex subunit STN1 isoform 1 [Schistosoma japonicum]|uniref:CST complex subunit STN1 n=1 Tax=Schistosoma japonicum TaxID=6182 RepID=C1LGY8_SCHJA|nr:CST complex subunit STN1 [Schistosoma japonicum]KAH8861070.1 CST complex subunit STN1 [Schistosoma japonicum]TNN17832.1 CST complex subunit STN1 isoform 1 [Schistosoma japonicum]CAX73966.1 Nucleic acid-binding, OB-fold,domain-containing protein [Schistosoma japonicum]
MSLSCLDDSRWLSAVLPDVDKAQSDEHALILDPLANEHYQLLLGQLSEIKLVGSHGPFRFGPRWILFIDVVGAVRSIYEREKFFIVELDDGTGCITCTIWRPDYSNNICALTTKTNSSDFEQNYLCDQLLKLSYKSQPISPSAKQSSNLHIGQILHLRGRLNCFRGKLKLNAYFCRPVRDESELLHHIIHRYHLHEEIYSHPYDPAAVAENIKKSRVINLANSLVADCCRVLVQDNIQLLTKLDLCLHPKIIESIKTNWTSVNVAFDETETNYLRQSFTEFDKEGENKPTVANEILSPKKLQLVITNLIERLLIDGWIFPATQSIGGMKTYCVVKENRNLLNAVYELVSSQGVDKELSLHNILYSIRRQSFPDNSQFTHITLNALKHLLNHLESESRIFQSNSGCYKAA